MNKDKEEFNQGDRDRWKERITPKIDKTNWDFDPETSYEKQKRIQQENIQRINRTKPGAYFGSEGQTQYEKMAEMFGPGGIHNPTPVLPPIKAQAEIAPIAKAEIAPIEAQVEIAPMAKIVDKGGKKTRKTKSKKTKSKKTKKIKSRK